MANVCAKCHGTGKWENPRNPRDFRTCFACKGTGQETVAKVGLPIKTDALRGLLAKFNRLHFRSCQVNRSRNGNIYCNEGGYGSAMLAYITPLDQIHPSRECSADRLAAITRDLENCMKAAIEYGKETGICCCCGAELTNPESIEAGIGPICASKGGF